MRHRPNHTYWKDHEYWFCGRHLPASPLPWSVEKCWLCPNKRPKMDARPAPDESKPKLIQQPQRRNFRPRARVVPKPVAADLVGSASPEPTPPTPKKVARQAKTATEKKIIPSTQLGSVTICAWPDCTEHARPRSKYCSRNCSNKNARARHKNRSKV